MQSNGGPLVHILCEGIINTGWQTQFGTIRVQSWGPYWPTESPDTLLTENIWHKIQQRRLQTVEHLKSHNKEEWEALTEWCKTKRCPDTENEHSQNNTKCLKCQHLICCFEGLQIIASWVFTQLLGFFGVKFYPQHAFKIHSWALLYLEPVKDNQFPPHFSHITEPHVNRGLRKKATACVTRLHNIVSRPGNISRCC